MLVDLFTLNQLDSRVDRECIGNGVFQEDCTMIKNNGVSNMKDVEVINATPHDITILKNYNVIQDAKTKQFSANPSEIVVIGVYEKSGILPRVSMSDELVSTFDGGVPIHTVKYGDIEGLPEQQEGTYYIVSGLVAAAGAKLGRTDLMAPGGLVRDAANSSTVLGCLFLQLQ